MKVKSSRKKIISACVIAAMCTFVGCGSYEEIHEEPQAETGSKSVDAIEESNVSLEEVYLDVVEELEEQYGVAQVMDGNKEWGVYYIDGSCFSLLDIDNDGSDELIAVLYNQNEEGSAYCFDYSLRIYDYTGNDAKCIYEQKELPEDLSTDVQGIYANLMIAEDENYKYVLKSEDGVRGYVRCGENHEFTVADTYYEGVNIYDDGDDYWVTYINGEKVTDEEAEAFRDKYKTVQVDSISGDSIDDILLTIEMSENVKHRLKGEKGESITSEKNESVSASREYSRDELLKKIQDYTQDEILNEPIYVDFDGDGCNEMVCEVYGTANYDYIELGKLYLVYTDGENTYEFGGTEDGCYYESNTFLIPVDDGYHLAIHSRWRNNIIQGSISYSGIYGLTHTSADTYLSKEFSALDNPQKGAIDITYHQEATAGEFPISTQTLVWDGANYY